VYKDAELNRLMGAAVAGNQVLREAVARFDSARAGARVARSRFFPDINAVPSALLFTAFVVRWIAKRAQALRRSAHVRPPLRAA
jgi:hypothetical protein